VVRVHGLLNIVETDDGGTYACHVRRLLKSMAIDGRNVVAAGDRVWFRPPDPGGDEGVIERVEPREGVLTRGYRGRRHVIAANVDAVLIVSALAEPGLKISLIDRYLAAAEFSGVRPVIVLNKADLVDVSLYQWVVGLYSQFGYETVVTSAADGRGLDRLRELLGRGVTAISGQSGVGKSSLLNALQPGLNLRVREVSDGTTKGKHTTTTAELIRLESGGYVVDTPGLRQFELWGVLPGELEGCFIEFRPFVPLCRFPDCSHTHEGRCAVKDAVYWGWIHAGRYESYLKLYHQKPDEMG
jgi:ribosome biogenesis GTPase